MNSHTKIVTLLIAKQHLLADLYRLFAGTYQDDEEFWMEACQREEEHARWLESFLTMIAEGKACYYAEENTINAIRALVKHIEDTIARFEQKPFTFERALAVATDIERAQVNKTLFDRFDGYSRSVQKLLGVIRENKRLAAIKMEAMQIIEQEKTVSR